MRTAVKVFAFTAGFSLAVAVLYWFLSYEEAGSVLLLFLFVAPLFVAAYLAWRGWRLRTAEDDPGAEHAAQAGASLGRFTAGSVWPFVMALASAVAMMGLVFGIWMLVVGILLLVWSGLGLLLESRD